MTQHKGDFNSIVRNRCSYFSHQCFIVVVCKIVIIGLIVLIRCEICRLIIVCHDKFAIFFLQFVVETNKGVCACRKVHLSYIAIIGKFRAVPMHFQFGFLFWIVRTALISNDGEIACSQRRLSRSTVFPHLSIVAHNANIGRHFRTEIYHCLCHLRRSRSFCCTERILAQCLHVPVGCCQRESHSFSFLRFIAIVIHICTRS